MHAGSRASTVAMKEENRGATEESSQKSAATSSEKETSLGEKVALAAAAGAALMPLAPNLHETRLRNVRPVNR